MIYEYFPDEVIELNKELASGYHKKLEEKLATLDPQNADIGARLRIICTHVGIMVDGQYHPEQIPELCGMILEKLKLLRSNPDGVIYVGTSNQIQ